VSEEPRPPAPPSAAPSAALPTASSAPAPAAVATAAALAEDEEPPLPDEAPPEAFAGFEAAPARPSAPAPLTQVFDRLRSFAQEENRGLFAALEGGRLLAKRDDALRIALPSAIAVRRLEARKPDLESVCARFFGRPVRAELVVDAGAAAAPAGAAKNAASGELARKRRQEALAHPALNAALEILGAEIDEIRPLGGAS
jgi:hypothetical protein